MDARHTQHDSTERDYRILPPAVRLEDTVEIVDPEPLPDAASVRNEEQHRALRDD